MLTEEQLREIRKTILMEADAQSVDQQQVEEQQIEPSVDEILNALQNGEIDVQTIDQLHNEGQMSDENYQAIVNVLNQQNEQAAEVTEPDPATVQQIVNSYTNGEITDEDIDLALQNGEIDEPTYNEILAQLQEIQAQEQPTEEPQPIVAKYNQVKLYDHYIKLKKLIDIHIETFSDIEIDQVTDFQIQTIYRCYKNIKELRDNIAFYMINNYTINTYNENLTQYVAMQRDFADEIRKLRNVLHLDPNKIIKEREEIKGKNKKK